MKNSIWINPTGVCEHQDDGLAGRWVGGRPDLAGRWVGEAWPGLAWPGDGWGRPDLAGQWVKGGLAGRWVEGGPGYTYHESTLNNGWVPVASLTPPDQYSPTSEHTAILPHNCLINNAHPFIITHIYFHQMICY